MGLTDDSTEEKRREVESQALVTIQTKRKGETKRRMIRKKKTSLSDSWENIRSVTYM